MPQSLPSVEHLRNALNEVRKACDQFAKEAREDDLLTPKLRANLATITNGSWSLDCTVDEIMTEINKLA